MAFYWWGVGFAVCVAGMFVRGLELPFGVGAALTAIGGCIAHARSRRSESRVHTELIGHHQTTHGKLDGITDATDAIAAALSVDWQNLGTYTPAHLKVTAIGVAEALRAFEAGFGGVERHLRAARFGSNPSPEQHAAMMKEILTRHADFDAEFRTRFLAKAQAVVMELRQRQGIVGCPAYDSPHFNVVLDAGGPLAGITPVAEIARYIQELALGLR